MPPMNDAVQTPEQSISFDNIIPPGPILDAVKKLGFPAPTAVQAETIPAAIKGTDLIVQARTGSGKTFAFAIPMLIKLAQAIKAGQGPRGTFGLIVTPTRELATQINEVITNISSDVKPACLIGGASIGAQIKALKEDPRIVVGTPGRILDLMRQRELSLQSCKMFVLDEADEMLSMGFLEDVRAILSRLPDQRQGLFVSATITPRVNVLAGSFLSKPEIIAISKPGEELAPIDHTYYEVGTGVTSKAAALCDLIEIMRPRSAMIFCNLKSDTETVEIFLRRRGFDARRLNSDLSQKERNYIMGKIKAQELRFLVGTDIASRGIDIEQMDLVINYSLPDVPESYVHRTGRTGRAGRAGTAVSLVAPQDFMAFTGLKRHLTYELRKLTLPTEDEVVAARLAHFYEIIREASVDVQDRDLAMARKLLQEMGNIEEPNEDICQAVAKLCKFTVEHALKLEETSIEEEAKGGGDADIDRSSSSSDQYRERRPDRGQSGDRAGGRGRGSGSRNRDSRGGGHQQRGRR